MLFIIEQLTFQNGCKNLITIIQVNSCSLLLGSSMSSYLPCFSVIVNSLSQLSYKTASLTPESQEAVRFLKGSGDCGAVKQGALIDGSS